MHSFPGVSNEGSTVWTTKRHYGKDGCKCIWKMWLQSCTALKGNMTGWKISMFNRNASTQMMDFPLSSRIWLVVSTHLKHISENGNLPQTGMNIKIFWNHHQIMLSFGGGGGNTFVSSEKVLCRSLPGMKALQHPEFLQMGTLHMPMLKEDSIKNCFNFEKKTCVLSENVSNKNITYIRTTYYLCKSLCFHFHTFLCWRKSNHENL